MNIRELVKEAGLDWHQGWRVGDDEINSFEVLVKLAIAHEREECASIVENANTPDCGGWTANGIADAIRARSKA